MPDIKFKIGSIGISFPNENQGYFSIFEDLAKLFGEEYQSHAVKLLRAKIKEIKPKPSIDYESDYTYIRTSNVDTLLSVINIIFELTIDEYRNGEVVDFLNLKIIFENAKKTRPKPKVWATGDVFSIPLIDDTFTFGQVLDKKYCTCALFNFKSKDNNINRSDFEQFTPPAGSSVPLEPNTLVSVPLTSAINF